MDERLAAHAFVATQMDRGAGLALALYSCHVAFFRRNKPRALVADTASQVLATAGLNVNIPIVAPAFACIGGGSRRVHLSAMSAEQHSKR